MNRRFFWVWLGSSALLGYWYAWVAITAVLHPASDPGGNLVYLSNAAGHTVYPFTYVAAALGFVGVTLFVYFEERPARSAALLAVLVGYVSAIGMIGLYEQVFLVGLESSTHSTSWWVADWGTPGAATWSLIGLTWVIAGLPWWRRANLVLTLPLVAVWIGSIAVWMALGFPSVQSGLGWGYALNTPSRIASELTVVALVTPDSIRIRILAIARRWRFPRRIPAPPIPSP
jgi:hypothetical protein